MSNNLFKIFFLLFFSFVIQQVFAQTSSLVSIGNNGKLKYTPDSKGNVVPDFSGVGYMNSEVAIPTIAIVKTVYPIVGDNLSNVQNAINQVAAMPLGSDGFRGGILFKKGTYNISDTIKITASGIVLVGEGSDSLGTCFIATKKAQYTLFYFVGSSGTSISNSSKKAITDAYIPFGTNKITVAPGHNFKVGNQVFVHRIPNQLWIDTLTMSQWGWTPNTYDVYYERKVTTVNGNSITLDAPIVDIIDTLFSKGELMRYSSNRISKCGIENMRISSYYASDTDENHGWEGVTFDNVVNSWARNLKVYYFGYSAVHILNTSSWITVQNSSILDAKSKITGERRYSFDIDGQRCLVENCFARKGRHDYVNGSRVAGPSVFYQDSAILQNNDIGPHHRWSTGILFDNINSNGSQDVQNRTSFGTGQGWAGGQIMFWNCIAGKMIIQDPQGDEINWAIGCVSPNITNVGDQVTEPLGFVESKNKTISAIPSLFKAQLNERLGTTNKLSQLITYDTFPTKLLGDTDFTPICFASSGLPITLTSLNTSVATIISGKIHIVGVGNAVITASQSGDTSYKPAPNYSQLLTVQSTLLLEAIHLNSNATKGGVLLNWSNPNMENLSSFKVERGLNPNEFQTIATIQVTNKNHFEYTDSIINGSKIYYRLKIILNNEDSKYSNIVLVDESWKTSIDIFPNPVKNVCYINGLIGINEMAIYNTEGKLIYKTKFTKPSNSSCSIDCKRFPTGLYILQIQSSGKNVFSKEFIKE